MSSRLWPVAWLVLCAVMLQVSAGNGQVNAVALLASAVLCGLAGRLTLVAAAKPRTVTIDAPASRRLRGRFLQQSRPGVPGRTRSRAPGRQH